MVGPWSAYVLGGIALQSLAVDIREHIELSVGIAYAWRPYTLTVYLLAVTQGELVVSKVKTVEAIGYVLPVHKVFRMQYHQSRHGVHSGACQIVVVAHAQYVRVRKLIIEQRVSKCTIAVICRP